MLHHKYSKQINNLSGYILFKEANESVFKRPLIYCHFAQGLGDVKYMPIPDWETLSKILHEAMGSYNDLVSAMNLVLFEDAMLHICR